jgi:hypothetical protein
MTRLPSSAPGRPTPIAPPAAAILILLALATAAPPPARSTTGAIPYDRFEEPELCAECHTDIARQYEQAMMSKSFTHPWDEIEYFELALPHSEMEPKVAGIKAGCIGCHAPLAFLAGDIPPKRPSEGTRANEGVSCEVCHTMVGFEGEVPFNFNYIHRPGEVKQGPRGADPGMGHDAVRNPFLKTAEFCGVCHNEKDPWGLWVKATHLEWQNGPHGRAGIVCQECHMPPAAGTSVPDGGATYPDVRQHLFHGAHDAGKLRGSVEIRMHADVDRAKPGDPVTITAVVINAKAGHMIPTGSAEERVVWLDVVAVDAKGAAHHLPVDPKGFPEEEYTIASSKAMAYQDIGEIMGIEDFGGLARDGSVPDGDRIFRLPYLDPKGRMTVAQWNTARFAVDYRLPPLQAITETFTWQLPDDIPVGPVTVTATIWYSRLVDSVAKFLHVPEAEYRPVEVNSQQTTFEVVVR